MVIGILIARRIIRSRKRRLEERDQSLIQAITLGAYEQAERILAENADICVNYADPVCGRTALHAAVLAQHEGLVRKLLARGADANLKDKGNCTALELARKTENQILIALFEGPMSG